MDRQSLSILNLNGTQSLAFDVAKNTRKRKRNRTRDEDDLEGNYLNALTREGLTEGKPYKFNDTGNRREQRQSFTPSTAGVVDAESRSEQESSQDLDEAEINHAQSAPQHESTSVSQELLDIGKSSRTVFLANVSTACITSKSAKKNLLEHLTSIKLHSDHDANVRVESLRFRSTAYANTKAPRKAAYVKRELMDATTKSTNAYVVYANQAAARKAAAELNGTMILDRHLRVDLIAHPAKIDHRRCVFIGNLGFVDDDSNINATENEEKKPRPKKVMEPADVEEGLWRQFGKAGVVESVRVVRDRTTRVGKGFAYVQFKDANAVESALLFDGKKYPPMLPRVLRVTRAKNLRKAANRTEKDLWSKRKEQTATAKQKKNHSHSQSLAGRASKLLGRAGAAQSRKEERTKRNPEPQPQDSVAKRRNVVFEGYRASQGTASGRSGKAQGKPKTRSSRRGAEFKARGRKKART